MDLTFPQQLDTVRTGVLAQKETLKNVAQIFAKSIAGGGGVHIYANGHSRITVEELCVRMGALTGFHPILSHALTNFTDVVGADSLRLNQAIEKVEGLGAVLLSEFDIAAGEPLIVVSATGHTQAAVDIAIEFNRRYPDNPVIAICSLHQSREAAPKHSSGKTLTTWCSRQSMASCSTTACRWAMSAPPSRVLRRRTKFVRCRPSGR